MDLSEIPFESYYIIIALVSIWATSFIVTRRRVEDVKEKVEEMAKLLLLKDKELRDFQMKYEQIKTMLSMKDEEMTQPRISKEEEMKDHMALKYENELLRLENEQWKKAVAKKEEEIRKLSILKDEDLMKLKAYYVEEMKRILLWAEGQTKECQMEVEESKKMLHVMDIEERRKIQLKEEEVKQMLQLKDEEVKQMLQLKDEEVKQMLQLKDEKVKEKLQLKDEEVKQMLQLKDEEVKQMLQLKDEKVKQMLLLKDEEMKTLELAKEEEVKQLQSTLNEERKKVETLTLLLFPQKAEDLLKITLRTQWGSKSEVVRQRRGKAAEYVIVDGHSYIESTEDYISYIQRQESHQVEYYGDMECNYWISDNGNVFEGLGWNSFNYVNNGGLGERSIKIGFIKKNGDDAPSAAAISVFDKLLKALICTDNLSADYALIPVLSNI